MQKIIKMLSGVLVMALLFVRPVQAYAGFQYEHDPMENPKAAKDIIVDENAVYGYSPNPESTRLGEYASYDWSDPEFVAKAQAERLEYHTKNAQLYQMINTMSAEGYTVEEIARCVSTRRNEIRIESYGDDKEGLEKLKASNLATYGREEGPTPDDLYAKYGSWETVIEKALSANPGMDACLGLYDMYYDTYFIEISVIYYEVRPGDSLWRIADRELNDGNLWIQIYELNKDVISSQYIIYRGQRLRLPA